MAAEDDVSEVLSQAPPPDAEIIAHRVIAAISSRRGRPDAGDAVETMWRRTVAMGVPEVHMRRPDGPDDAPHDLLEPRFVGQSVVRQREAVP